MEINRIAVSFFAGELDKPAFADLSGDKEWFPGSLLARFEKALSKKGKPYLLKQAGKKFGAVIYGELKNHYEWDSIQEAIAYLPKIYTRLFKGDQAGIWISEELSAGFVRIRENTPFDCFFTEGLLSGLLSSLDARGGMVRHPSCRKENENEKFCTYELVWMKNIRS